MRIENQYRCFVRLNGIMGLTLLKRVPQVQAHTDIMSCCRQQESAADPLQEGEGRGVQDAVDSKGARCVCILPLSQPPVYQWAGVRGGGGPTRLEVSGGSLVFLGMHTSSSNYWCVQWQQRHLN